mmetsp:Transcript_1678/g.2325  ORF Transcript_1678/g.2325 Transcript_1678/m.2325 type:complete len:640 (+) Transcript_1678:2-1921(+)
MNITRFSASSKECAVDKVTVYKNRAEVVRKIKFPIPQVDGEHKLEIRSIADKVDPDSFRVKGTNICQVIEVSHSRCFTQEPENKDISELSEEKNEKVNQLKAKLQILTKEALIVKKSQQRIKNKLQLVDKYVGDSFNAQKYRCSMEEAKAIFQYHNEVLVEYDNDDIELSERLKSIGAEMESVRDELSVLTALKPTNIVVTEPTRTVFILVKVIKNASSTPIDGLIELSLSYIVSDALWKASYDIRVDTTGGTESMQVAYFAEVEQRSGEDWSDCSMLLSTTNPAVGSSPPLLPVMTVGFEQRSPIRNNLSYTDDHEDSYSTREREGSLCLMNDNMYGMYQSNVKKSEKQSNNYEKESVGLAGLAGTGDAGSTLFVINHRVSIPSDGKPHKVMVTLASFIPQLVHYLAPSVSTSAYLQAKARNSSQYPLLASQQVSVFLDDCFVCKSSLKQTNPGETFTIYLGADLDFKADYLPCRVSVSSKWLSGTQTKSFTYTTILHNTKRTARRVIVAEVLPVSQHGDIKVELMEPSKSSLSKTSESFQMLSNNEDIFQAISVGGNGGTVATPISGAPSGKDTNVIVNASAVSEDGWPKDFVSFNETTSSVVWLKSVPPNSKVELKFHYRISSPQGKNIDIRSISN